MIESTQPGQEASLSRSEKLMRGVFDTLIDRTREGIRSGRIAVVVDTGEDDPNTQPQPLQRLAAMLQEGGILIANHTEPDNTLHQFLKDKMTFGGSTPLDAIILLAMIEEMKALSESGKAPVPTMLQGDNFTAVEGEAHQQVKSFQRAASHRVELLSVVPGGTTGSATGRNLSALRQAVTRVGQGGIVVAFPEGDTHPAHEPLREHAVLEGIALLARPQQGKAPKVIPLYIAGSEHYLQVLGKGNDTVQIYVGRPQQMEQQGTQDRSAFMQQVWGEVCKMQEIHDPSMNRATSLA